MVSSNVILKVPKWPWNQFPHTSQGGEPECFMETLYVHVHVVGQCYEPLHSRARGKERNWHLEFWLTFIW
jgi:hypothetical protein